MQGAIEKIKGGCIIHIKVKFGNEDKFPAGYDRWRKRINVIITEEPIKGKANNKIIEILISNFNLTKNDIDIIYGKKSTKKGIVIKKNIKEVMCTLNNGL